MMDLERLAGVMNGLSPDLPQWSVLFSFGEQALFRPSFGVTTAFEAVKFVRKRVEELEAALEEANRFLDSLHPKQKPFCECRLCSDIRAKSPWKVAFDDF